MPFNAIPVLDGAITDTFSQAGQAARLGELRWVPKEKLTKELSSYASGFEGTGVIVRFVKATAAAGLTIGQLARSTMSSGAGLYNVKSCDAAGVASPREIQGVAVGTVAQNYYGWVICWGPCRPLSADGGIVALEALSSHTSGQVDTNPADGTEGRIGMALEDDGATGEAFWAFLDVL